MIPVNEDTKRRIEALFERNDYERVSQFLERECGDNLPLVEPSYHDLVERIRFAVLKLSEGNFEQLRKQTAEAAKDWRDILMAAGFGEDTKAHLAWEPTKRVGT